MPANLTDLLIAKQTNNYTPHTLSPAVARASLPTLRKQAAAQRRPTTPKKAVKLSHSRSAN